MKSNRSIIASSLFAILSTTLFASAPAAAEVACEQSPVVLQVLGSGGPRGLGRASAGYLVRIDGVGRVMVDAGGGTFARFHEAGASVADLELLALSHFHADHSSEVPALLWLKPTDMLFSGPSGSESYPSASEYAAGMFGPDGVYRAVTSGKGLNTLTVDVNASEPTEVFANASMRVSAIGVPHGPVPALGYRIDVGDTSIAFSSDQNGSDPAFTEFASGVDVLVVHFAAPESMSNFPTGLHARPSVWGQMATDADIGLLVLSHLSGVAPANAGGEVSGFDDKLKNLRSTYKGPLLIAEDLMCVPVGQ
jgi:ribonuclease BN (tRNA processing enzyme)